LASGRTGDVGILYDRHASAVLGFLYRRTADPDMATDLTAETFAQAFLRAGGSGTRVMAPEHGCSASPVTS
jgi:DNA-directed RNA polymerase specialized sigma24 family protein